MAADDTHEKLLPEGKCSFDLPMGKIRIRVLDLPTSFEPFVSEHYAPFAEPVARGQHADLTLSCRLGPEEVVIPLPGPGQTPVIDVDHQPPRTYRIRSHWQHGQVNLATAKGELIFTDRHEIPLRMSLENFLRVTSQLLLLERDAFLLHTAGILDGGRCYLFFGHSGAGKSTATELSAPRAALSDDMVLIDAATSTAQAHAVPFFGAYPLAQRVRGSFPVAAAFRLRQDTEDRMVTLSTARAVATLASSVPFVQELGLRRDGLTELVTRVCRRTPVFDLHFKQSSSFWDLIHRELPD